MSWSQFVWIKHVFLSEYARPRRPVRQRQEGWLHDGYWNPSDSYGRAHPKPFVGGTKLSAFQGLARYWQTRHGLET